MPLTANVLFVSINVSLEKISVKFPPFANSFCVISRLKNLHTCVEMCYGEDFCGSAL